MAHYGAQNTYSQEWRLSNVWRPPSSLSSLGGGFTHERKRSCEQDGLSPNFFSNSTTRPSARLAAGKWSTTEPTPLRRHQGPGRFYHDQPSTTAAFPYTNRAAVDEVVSPDTDYDEESRSMSDIELEIGEKWDARDDVGNGAQGLVRPEHSARHSGIKRAMSGRISRSDLLRRMSSDYISRTMDRRRSKRESRYISDGSHVFDWPLTANRYKASPPKAIFPPSDEWLSEKIPAPVTPSFPPKAEPDPNLVAWDGPNDPGNPMNWPRTRKWACTLALGLTTFCVTFASSVFSPGTEVAAREFGVSIEIMILATALFVLGFAFGPIIWGPFSELYGRKVPLFVGVAIFAIFQVPCAIAPNLATLLACRFLAGFFGCAPLSIVGGAMADFWAPVDRGVAVSIFSCATFLGPTVGPLVGGFLTQTPGFGWRWTAWVTLFATVVFGTISWFVYPESFAPVLLQRRAKQRRFATRNWAVHAPADEIEINSKAILAKYLSKPFMMLAYEPILLLMTIYISFIYGILYLFFETYPLTFHVQHGWSLGATGLPFLAVMVGVLVGGCVNYIFVKTRYVRILKAKGRVPPEERLVPMMVGAVALPAGLFLYAWTSDFESPWPQIVAGAPCGMGIVLIFLQGLNYIIDCYMMFSNSAIAGNTFIRSLFGAGFPMFATYMYQDLGVKWATSVLGFIAVGLMPVPLLFFIFGERIRKMSKFVPQLPPGMMGGPPGGPPGAMEPAMAKSAPLAVTAPLLTTQQQQQQQQPPVLAPPPATHKTLWRPNRTSSTLVELSATRPTTPHGRSSTPDSTSSGSSNSLTFACAGQIPEMVAAPTPPAVPASCVHYDPRQFFVFPAVPARIALPPQQCSSCYSVAAREFAAPPQHQPRRVPTRNVSNFSYKNPSPVPSRPGTAVEMHAPGVGRF